jgi:hypothetical protein
LQIFEKYQKIEISEMKSTVKNKEIDNEIPNIGKIGVMNVIVKIRFI